MVISAYLGRTKHLLQKCFKIVYEKAQYIKEDLIIVIRER